MAGGAPQVRLGSVIALRLFDVAYAIDLPQAEALWAAQPRPASIRGQLISTPPKAVAFGVPPVEVSLPPLTLALDGREVAAPVAARLYDFGVVTLAVQVAARELPWAGFVRLVNAVDAAIGPGAGAPVWQDLLAKLRAVFQAALVKPAASTLEEDYLIGNVQGFTEGLTAAELQDRVDLAPLLSGETRELSESARRDLLNRRFSYYEDDLVALTWDRAFVYDPVPDSDVLDVLEVANAQLLEMRYYDELLDAELPRMYDMVENTQRLTALWGSRRFAKLARRLYGLVAEVTELTEKVDNALQVTEDVYLARIYASALNLLRVPAVSAAVDRKLAIIRDTYAALYEEASAGRAALMEAAILILIAVEIVLAVIRKM
jgi:hypothetical protein